MRRKPCHRLVIDIHVVKLVNNQNNYFGLGPILIQKLKMAYRSTSQITVLRDIFPMLCIFIMLIAQWYFLCMTFLNKNKKKSSKKFWL